ncbi:MAG: Shedu immune nuclease family protein [Candidatus Sedimenticola sp. (ex Thyasira tokunagai)]
MVDDYEYFQNKRSDRVYLSRSLDKKEFSLNDDKTVTELVRPFRIVSKIVNSKEDHQFIKDGKEISLRITDSCKQEIKAKFYEDTRGIFTLQIQKYTVSSGMPHNTYFTFIGSEISTLYNFLRNIAVLPLSNKGSSKLDDKFIEELVLTKAQAIELVSSQPEIFEELIKHNTTTEEISLLGNRKKQLLKFEKLLNDTEYFESCRLALGSKKRVEDVWQNFFEENTWIFGYGLCYQFNAPLEGKKLEQVVSGHNFNSAGKRIDGLLKTTGLLSSLAFIEIKTHKTELLSQVKDPYRTSAWNLSKELTGGIVQVQRTVQMSIQNLQTKTEIVSKSGALTGEQLFLYTPRSFLVIGSLAEFHESNGINEQKYSSFEMFRRNMSNTEVITFDELFQRATHIVEAGSVN